MTCYETIRIDLPAHWIPAALFGDMSGLDKDQSARFLHWLDDTVEDVGHGETPRIGMISAAPRFARYHDAVEYGIPACDCYTVDLLVREPLPDYDTATGTAAPHLMLPAMRQPVGQRLTSRSAA